MPKKLNALIDLLDDPDEKVFVQIKDELMAYGDKIIPMLEHTWENTIDKLIQERIEFLIHDIQFNNLIKEFKTWAGTEELNIMEGALLIARYQYPDLNTEIVYQEIEKIKKDIWLELNENLTALEKINVINEIIYTRLGFRGNLKNINSPTNSFINDVVETKKGNSLTLSIIYLTIAQDLGLPIYGVNLPENFIIAYKDESGLLEEYEGEASNIMFYIDPFSKGVVFPKKQILEFLKHIKLEPKESHFVFCDNKTILVRMIKTLIDSYTNLGYTEKVEELNMFLNCLAPLEEA